MEIRIERNMNPKAKPENPASLGFGMVFSDHMFLMDYTRQEGWHDARIVPYGDLAISPASTVLHYGAEIFEGLKAYRRPDGEIQLFRPWDNFERMNNSAERLCLPELDKEFCLKALKQLIDIDRDWVPSAPGTSLYIRPFMFGNDPFLGVHAPSRCVFCIILSPSGSYYKEGVNPVRIMIETADVRAVRGGTGYAKCGGNYAASLRAGEKAAEKGFAQVLWLDGVERKYVEEVGSMNVMFKIGGKIVTPELTGSVLPGITRKSCIELLKEWGYEVEERLLSIDELMEAAESGALEEAWGTGTAAVVSPISDICYMDKSLQVKDGGIGPVTQKLYDTITGIQYGRIPDTRNWIVPVC